MFTDIQNAANRAIAQLARIDPDYLLLDDVHGVIPGCEA